MAIQFPTAGAIYTVAFEAASVQAICDAIKNALSTCGWTPTPLPSSMLITFNGLPTNNQSATIGGLVYTFVTGSLTAVRQIKVGATAAACATNLMECLTAGANGGTDYYAGTSALPNVTVTQDSATSVRITSTGTGFAANSAITVTTGWSNVAWTECTSGGTSWGRGYKMVMPNTPQGLSGAVWLENLGSTYIRLRCGSPDESVMSAGRTVYDTTGAWSLNVSAGRYLRFVGCAHQFFIYMVTDTGTASGTQFQFCVPWIKAIHVPLTVIGATNTSPIELTTSVNHGFATNQVVFNADIRGNTAANGSFTITVTASDKYTLNGSTGNGAWTSGGLTGLALSQIQRLMLVMGDTSSGSYQTFRTSAWPGCGGTYTSLLVALNGVVYKYQTSSTNANYGPRLLATRTSNNATATVWGGVPRIVDPSVFLPALGLNVGLFEVGQLWATFVTQEAVPADRQNTGFLGHNWTQVCANSKTNGSSAATVSIWMATS